VYYDFEVFRIVKFIGYYFKNALRGIDGKKKQIYRIANAIFIRPLGHEK